MADPVVTKTSKKISYLLRHHPEEAHLKVDKYGYVPVKDLIKAVGITTSELDLIVESNDKKRFVFSKDKTLIKCAQGHSYPVELELEPTPPPPVLYHGTASKFIGPITAEGLKAMSRQHVHLSADTETAYSVGKRHGSPVIFCVDCDKMVADGHKFYMAENGVWLAHSVPPEYLTLFDRKTQQKTAYNRYTAACFRENAGRKNSADMMAEISKTWREMSEEERAKY